MQAKRTGELAGMRLPHWLSLLLKSRGLPTTHWPELLRLTVQSALNEFMFWEEERQLGRAIEAVQPADPIIVTGFPRSGTTFLHQLLCQDERLGYPTTLQVSNPHTFFFLEGKLPGLIPHLGRKLYGHWIRLWWSNLGGDWKREVDNVRESLQGPSEDEYALLMMNCSPLLGLTLFRHLEGPFAEAYTTLAQTEARLRWQVQWKRFLQKLSLYWGGRPLVCKSHFHQARISPILELFPKARFIYIHRHPEQVFSSWCHLMSLIRPELSRTSQRELFCLLYRRHVGAYLEQRGALAEDQLCELSYDKLVAQPIETIKTVYQTLSLPPNQPDLPNYQTNRYPPLAEQERAEISHALAHIYEAFGYG